MFVQMVYSTNIQIEVISPFILNIICYLSLSQKVSQNCDSKVALQIGKIYVYLFSVYKSPDMAACKCSDLSLSEWLLTNLIHQIYSLFFKVEFSKQSNTLSSTQTAGCREMVQQSVQLLTVTPVQRMRKHIGELRSCLIQLSAA